MPEQGRGRPSEHFSEFVRVNTSISAQRTGVVGLVDAETQQQYSRLRLSDVPAAHSLLLKRFDVRLRQVERHRPGPSLAWDQAGSVGCHGVGHTPRYEALCDKYRGGTRGPRSMSDGLAQVVAGVARSVSEANPGQSIG